MPLGRSWIAIGELRGKICSGAHTTGGEGV